MTHGGAGVSIESVGYDTDVARRLVGALDADLDVRYAADDPNGDEPDHALLNMLTDDVSPPKGVFLVALLGGEAVGCGALRASPVHGPGVAEIKRMYVAPEARGRGISRRLLAALEAEAVALGYGEMVLETGTRQQEAMALYESAGFTAIPDYGAYRASSLSRCYGKRLVPGPSRHPGADGGHGYP